ncbi:MAG: hypothetical protein QOH26_1584, partial [Actinomycetota bacterium]|nr:hypothetical protein [Actinomycetota bacterium]
ADVKLPDDDSQTAGDHGWRVVMAQSLNGLGCGSSSKPGFRTAVATPKRMHTGTICSGGTACQAQAIDRRLGDFFTIEIDNTGRVWGGYSNTTQGGATALPAFVRQSGGPSFGRTCDTGPSRQNKKRGQAGPCMLAPLVGLGASDQTPARGDSVRLKVVLKACKLSNATKQLKGTRVNLLRKRDGRFVKIAGKKVNDRCRASFTKNAGFGRAVFKAKWPKQLDAFRAGRSLPLTIKTH